MVSDESIIAIIKTLSGLQEKFFYLVLEHCNLNSDIQTGQLKTVKLASFIGCDYRSVKTTIERVVKKSLIKRLKGKGSVAGFVQFEMLKEIKIIGNRLMLQKRNIDNEFDAFISAIRQQIRQQSDNRSDNNLTSSSIYIKTTTTGEAENLLSGGSEEEWLEVDLEPLEKIGFTRTHLFQIASQ